MVLVAASDCCSYLEVLFQRGHHGQCTADGFLVLGEQEHDVDGARKVGGDTGGPPWS